MNSLAQLGVAIGLGAGEERASKIWSGFSEPGTLVSQVNIIELSLAY